MGNVLELKFNFQIQWNEMDKQQPPPFLNVQAALVSSLFSLNSSTGPPASLDSYPGSVKVLNTLVLQRF